MDWEKINVDASFCKDKLFNRIGLVIRDTHNSFGAARVSSRRFASSEEGEALAVLDGILWAQECRIQRVVIETDAETICFFCRNGSAAIAWTTKAILQECLALFERFVDICICFVPHMATATAPIILYYNGELKSEGNIVEYKSGGTKLFQVLKTISFAAFCVKVEELCVVQLKDIYRIMTRLRLDEHSVVAVDVTDDGSLELAMNTYPGKSSFVVFYIVRSTTSGLDTNPPVALVTPREINSQADGSSISNGGDVNGGFDMQVEGSETQFQMGPQLADNPIDEMTRDDTNIQLEDTLMDRVAAGFDNVNAPCSISDRSRAPEPITLDPDALEMVDLTDVFTTDKVFDSREEVLQWVREEAKKVKAVVVIRRGENRKPRMMLGCERGGGYYGKKFKGEEKWRRVGGKPKDIMEEIKTQFPDNVSSMAVVYNAIRREMGTEISPVILYYNGELKNVGNIVEYLSGRSKLSQVSKFINFAEFCLRVEELCVLQLRDTYKIMTRLRLDEYTVVAVDVYDDASLELAMDTYPTSCSFVVFYIVRAISSGLGISPLCRLEMPRSDASSFSNGGGANIQVERTQAPMRLLADDPTDGMIRDGTNVQPRYTSMNGVVAKFDNAPCSISDLSDPLNNEEIVGSNSDHDWDYTKEFTSTKLFNGRDELLTWVREVARSLGFVITISKSHLRTNNYPRTFMQCDRSGKYRTRCKNDKNKDKNYVKRRHCISKKDGCPFEIRASKKGRRGDFWQLRVTCGRHNHPSAQSLEGHAYAERLTQEEERIVAEMIKINMKPKDILDSLKELRPENCSSVNTIYNARKKIMVKMRDERQQAIENYEGEDDEPMVDLFVDSGQCSPI
ncbi:hypothetical protein GIB67_018601 [Kingdonia uniflora]|uniref:RNase H type-1 domain-containing protein n=1 Tax=Kingdonia uniflora TaxID=39325 RepID=A0A7J7L8J4_9MAGN|nr:hypothetical protein GIB67_018601 [Kingdonia uniflora]